MAKSKSTLSNNTFVKREPKRRSGIVSKSKASKNPNSKTYLKRYRGQGR